MPEHRRPAPQRLEGKRRRCVLPAALGQQTNRLCQLARLQLSELNDEGGVAVTVHPHLLVVRHLSQPARVLRPESMREHPASVSSAPESWKAGWRTRRRRTALARPRTRARRTRCLEVAYTHAIDACARRERTQDGDSAAGSIHAQVAVWGTAGHVRLRLHRTPTTAPDGDRCRHTGAHRLTGRKRRVARW